MYDVVIVGGGPAGVAAGLVLARARKRILIVDEGKPANAASRAMHGFPTRDGTAPSEMRRLALAELERYGNPELRAARAEKIWQGDDGALHVTLAGDDLRIVAKRVLLATGIVDVLPDIPGLVRHWCRGVHPCPYCDGWELGDKRWGLLVTSEDMAELALSYRGWTGAITAFTNGDERVAEAIRARLEPAGLAVEARPIVRLESNPADPLLLGAIVVRDDVAVPCDALFLRPDMRLPPIIEELGLARDDNGFVEVDDDRQSSISGIHVAGDATGIPRQVLLAAADGMIAAMAIRHALDSEV